MVERFAEQALIGEKLGQHEGATDLLTVSFSSNDYVGHAVGPDAPEVRDMARRTDQLLGQFLKVIDERVGLANTVVVLTADHGVAATPAHDEEAKLPGGYIRKSAEAAVQNQLEKVFGQGQWVLQGGGESNIYFNWDAMRDQNKAPADAYRWAREALLGDPDLHVARVYTREELNNGVAGDFIAMAALNGYFPPRSGDLTIVYEPGYIVGKSGTSHFSPYAYDRHVPVLFLGWGIKPGRYDETVRPNDIAPTLATMLDVQTPSGSSGRVLTEMLRTP
jgi:predicted AlkP superfamily pyrophosphatase or phosphodiesterase